MENWEENINFKIDSNLGKVKEKDLRFFRVDEFKRNIKRVHEFSSACPYCNQQKIDIAEVAEIIGEAIQVPGNSRRTYDRLIGSLAKHMRKEHGFYTPYWFSYLYAFYGLIAGFILGIILNFLFPDNKGTMYAIGITVCIVAAYIAGSRKDNKIRMTKKLM